MNVRTYSVAGGLAPIAAALLLCLAACTRENAQDGSVSEPSAALLDSRTQTLHGRWRMADSVVVFDPSGYVFHYAAQRNTRRAYRWLEGSAELLVGPPQPYYAESEAKQYADVYGGTAALQAILNETYCVEQTPLNRSNGERFELSEQRGSRLQFRAVASDGLEALMGSELNALGLRKGEAFADQGFVLEPEAL